MNWRGWIVTTLALASAVGSGQTVGGSAYGQGRSGKDQAELNERAKRTVSSDDKPTSATSVFLDASVLMNVLADEYVAVFGISQDGATMEECAQKANATLARFSTDLNGLGVKPGDVFADFVAQNRTYGYEVNGEIAKEKLTGFELKKNISIHYRDKAMLDQLIAAAAKSQIFDLIKVDYVVRDIGAVHARLMEEAARIVKQKAAQHERFLGIKLRQPSQLYAEKYSSYSPTDMYDSYIAYESEDVSGGYYRQKYIVQGARKSRTFFFNALDAKGFDKVVNPVIVEPVVQFTLYLRVRFETGANPTPTPKPSEPKAKAKMKMTRSKAG